MSINDLLFRHRDEPALRARKLNELRQAVEDLLTSGFTVDGGNATTTYNGTLVIDFGGAT